MYIYYICVLSKYVILQQSDLYYTYGFNYLCDFVVRDFKIAVYLETPRKIDFNLVSDFFSK